MMNKSQYEKWLRKQGLLPSQVKEKTKSLGNPNSIPNYKTPEYYSLSNGIGNGTKETDMSKSKFCNENYAMVPLYNKGPIGIVSKEDLKQGAGRKI